MGPEAGIAVGDYDAESYDVGILVFGIVFFSFPCVPLYHFSFSLSFSLSC